MKAYCGEVKDDPDLGMEILFANTVREAKKQFIGSEVASQADSFLDLDAYRDWETDRKSTRLNSSHSGESRMPSSA